MKQIHDLLVKRNEWYQNWHQKTYHHTVHWLALAVVIIIVLATNHNSFKLASLDRALAKHSDNVPALTNDLKAATRIYNQSRNSNEKNDALAIATTIASTRKELLLKKLRSADDGQIAEAVKEISSADLTNIPVQLSQLVEQPATLNGNVEVLLNEDFENSTSRLTYHLTSNGKTHELHFENKTDADFLDNGLMIEIKEAYRIEDEIVMSEGSTALFTGVSPEYSILTESPGVIRDRKILFMLQNYTDKTSVPVPFSQTEANGAMFTNTDSVANYFKEQTFGQTILRGDTTPWFTINQTCVSPDPTKDTKQMRIDAVTALGYDTKAYDYLVIYSNCGSGGGVAGGGTATIGGGGILYIFTTGSHEIGHLLDLEHASTLSCGTKSTDVATNCSVKEYGDSYTQMGLGSYNSVTKTFNRFHVNGAHKYQLGAIADSKVTISTTQTGTYTITPLEIPTTGKQLLRVPTNDGMDYYVDYRQPLGFDANLPAGMTSGVSIYRLAEYTFKIDTTPGDGDFVNAPLTDGKSFTDPINGITITQISHDSTGATVRVTYTGAVPVARSATLTTPTEGQNVSGSVAIAANIINGGTIKQVFFKRTDGTVITMNSNPSIPSATWNSKYVPNGLQEIYAEITSAAPGIGIATNPSGPWMAGTKAITYTTPRIKVNVQNALDTTLPVVSLTSPLPSAVLSGSVNISANATDNISVTKVDFYHGTTLIGATGSAPYNISWNTAALANGTYSLTAKAYDTSGNTKTSTPVSVTVNNTSTPSSDTTLPTVSLTSPLPGSVLSGSVNISANATDNIGVTKVDFYQGTTFISTDTTSPYSVSWNTASVSNGTYSLTARAYDAAGNTRTSTPVSVSVSNTVVNPISVSITSPLANATLSNTFPIVATTTGTIDHVDFYRGTTLIGADALAPYGISWDTKTVTNGTYTISAKAYTSIGSSATSAPVSVVISNTTTPTADTTQPTVSLTGPTGTVSGTTTVSANATDNIGVTKVDFYRGSSLISTDTTSPYAVAWNTTSIANGTYSLTARAFDAAGNSKTSTALSVTVSNATNKAPVVSAGSDQTIILPTLSATLSGTATDDGLPTPPTFSTTWTKVSGPGTVTFSSQNAASSATFSTSGTYVLRLRATDGTLATTDDVSISIISQPTSGTFSDDFSRADGPLTSPWSVISGAFNIVSNELKTGTGSGYQIATLPASSGTTTQQIGANFALTSSSQSSKLGVVFRVQNASNYYACYRINGGTSTRRIVKVVNGVETILGQSNVSNPTVGVYFPLSCSISGTTITMKQGTTTLLTVNDGTFSSGSVGILSGLNASTNTSEKIDSVSAGW